MLYSGNIIEQCTDVMIAQKKRDRLLLQFSSNAPRLVWPADCKLKHLSSRGGPQADSALSC